MQMDLSRCSTIARGHNCAVVNRYHQPKKKTLRQGHTGFDTINNVCTVLVNVTGRKRQWPFCLAVSKSQANSGDRTFRPLLITGPPLYTMLDEAVLWNGRLLFTLAGPSLALRLCAAPHMHT